MYGVLNVFPLDKQREILKMCFEALNKGGIVWVGANLYVDASYIYQTYPVPHNFYTTFLNNFSNIRMEEYKEWEIFKLRKYEKTQTSILFEKI